MFKLSIPQIKSKKASKSYELDLVVPLSQGSPDKSSYAEVMSGYTVSDNYRPEKTLGFVMKSDEKFVKVREFGDDYFIFKDIGNDYVNLSLYSHNLQFIEDIGNFPINALQNKKECINYDVDGVEFGNYFVFQVGGAVMLYSKNGYFQKFNYVTNPNNDLKVDNYILGLTSGAKGRVVATGLQGSQSSYIDLNEGNFIEGEDIEEYEVVTEEIINTIPETINEDGSTAQESYDNISYVKRDKLINTYTIKDINLSEDFYQIILDNSDSLYFNDDFNGGKILSVTDNFNFNNINKYGVYEIDIDTIQTGTYDNVEVLTTARKFINMSWGVQGYVLDVMSSGRTNRLLVGDVIQTPYGEVPNGGSAVYYSGVFIPDGTIPFSNWTDTSFSNTGSGGYVFQAEDGDVTDILTYENSFVALRNKGLTDYRFTYFSERDRSAQRIESVYIRECNPIAFVDTPNGAFYISQDGLYKMNRNNAGGKVDKRISDVLGRRFDDMDFSNSKMMYNKGKLYILYKVCTTDTCTNNSVLIYDIEKDLFTVDREWNFVDFTDKVAVGINGLYELFSDDFYGIDIGLSNSNSKSTRLLTKEFTRSKKFFIDNYYFKFIGGSNSIITVNTYGRVDGVPTLIQTDEIESKSTNNSYFSSRTCTDELGIETYFFTKVKCHKDLSSVWFEILSDDYSPHEIVSIGLGYTITRQDRNC